MTPHDLDIFWRTVWGEARGEPQVGKDAVAHAIWNRTGDRRWPDSVADVCLQPWQFSCWNEDDPNLPKIKAADPDLLCIQAVINAVMQADFTLGANHYMRCDLYDSNDRPGWADNMELTAIIGDHVFLRG